MGVALVNVHAVARGWLSHYGLNFAAHGGDVVAEYVVGMFFSHRSFPLLAFLFGVGIAMQWQRMDATARDVRTLRGRYGALLILGIAHALLLWPGDIVSAYAIVALVLLIRWPKRDKTLLIFIGILGALTLSLYPLFALIVAATPSDASFESAAMAIDASSFANASFAQAWAAHLHEYLFFGIAQVMLPEVWLAILIGMYLAQSDRLARWLRGEARGRVWFGIGFALFAIGSVLELYASTAGGWDYTTSGGYGDPIMMLALPLTMVGSVFVWLAISRAWGVDTARRLRELLIAGGRTPLTQFFGQSLVFAIVFNKSLIGWHGELGRLAYSLVAILTYFLWAGFSRAWLAAGHERGPMETLWLALSRRLAPSKVP